MPPCAVKRAHWARATTWALTFWATDRPSEPQLARFWSHAPRQHSWYWFERSRRFLRSHDLRFSGQIRATFARSPLDRDIRGSRRRRGSCLLRRGMYKIDVQRGAARRAHVWTSSSFGLQESLASFSETLTTDPLGQPSTPSHSTREFREARVPATVEPARLVRPRWGLSQIRSLGPAVVPPGRTSGGGRP
jgi:hypothetical protein